VQQKGIRQFVDAEAQCRHGKEAFCGPPDRGLLAPEGQVEVPGERYAKCNQPTQYIGNKGLVTQGAHGEHDNKPVGQGGGATDADEPAQLVDYFLHDLLSRGPTWLHLKESIL